MLIQKIAIFIIFSFFLSQTAELTADYLYFRLGKSRFISVVVKNAESAGKKICIFLTFSITPFISIRYRRKIFYYSSNIITFLENPRIVSTIKSEIIETNVDMFLRRFLEKYSKGPLQDSFDILTEFTLSVVERAQGRLLLGMFTPDIAFL